MEWSQIQMTNITLRQADRVDVTVLVDNYTDMLMIQDTDVVRRPKIPPPTALLAEHGLSCLIQVYEGSKHHTVLMDAGISPACFFHNEALLKSGLDEAESVVLSHGHPDHFGALTELLKRFHRKTPLVLHPDVFLDRRMNIPAAGRPFDLPVLKKDTLRNAGADLIMSDQPTSLASGLIYTTGIIERVIPFEKGFPPAEAKIDGAWVSDPFRDDQGLVANVKGRGLVVISGCAHAGIINTIEHAKKITGIDKVHAVLGGFHLTGPFFDPIISPTIEEMKRINPDYIVPLHCTGWNAINRFAQEMPGQFILNTVGTTFVFSGAT